MAGRDALREFPPAAPPRRGWRLAAVGALIAGAAVAMLMTSGQMADVRMAVPPLSQAMNWLDLLPLPLDMYHVAFFALLGLAVRLLLPRVRWGWLLLGLAALAVATEVLQFGTVGRTPKVVDVRDDLIGSALGLLAGAAVLRCAGQAGAIVRVAHLLLLAGIALLPVQQWPVREFLGFPILPSDALLILAVAVRALAFATGSAPLALGGFHAWLAAYLATLLLALLVLHPLAGTAGGNRPIDLVPGPDLGLAAAKWVGVAWLVALGALACDAAARVELRRGMLRAWLAATVLAALAGWIGIVGFYAGAAAHPLVASMLSHYGSLPPGPYPRVHGTFANANMAGLFLLLSVAMALAGRAAGWLSGRQTSALLMLASVPLLASASQAIGAVGLLLAWWWARTSAASRPARACVLAGGAMFALGVLGLLLVNPAAPLGEPSVRMQLWRAAWQSWQGDFWRGNGLGQPAATLEYLAPDGAWQRLTDAHNIVLSLGAQGGLPAVAAFIGLCGWTWWRARATRDRALAPLAAGLLLAIAYLGLGGAFEDARVLWIYLGVVAGWTMALRPQAARAIPPP